MNTRRKWIRMVAAACAMITAPLFAQVMDSVPSQSLVVVQVSNITKLSGAIGQLVKDYGLDQMAPPPMAKAIASPIDMVQEMTGIKDGLDLKTEAALAVVLPENGFPIPKVYVVLPLSDAKAFLGNFKDAKTENGITTSTIGTEDVAMMVQGRYAILTDDADNLKGLKLGAKAPQGVADLMKDNDVTAYLNFTAVSKKVLPQLKQFRQKEFKKLLGQMSGSPEVKKYAKVIEVAANQGLNVAEEFLMDAEAICVAARLSDKGINSSLMVQFTPGSYIGKMVSDTKTSGGGLLAGLPKAQYLMVFGGTQDPVATRKVFDDIVGPILAEAKNVGPEAETIAKAVGLYGDMIGSVSGMSFGLLSNPAAKIGQDALIQGVGVYTGDAQKMRTSQKQLMAIQDEIMAMIPGGGPKAKTTFTLNAKTVSGVSLDSFTGDFKPEGNSPADQMAMQMIVAMYGPQGLSGYSGTIDAKTMFFAMGVNDKMLELAVNSAKKGQDELSSMPNVAVVAGELQKQRCFEGYVMVDQMVSMGLNIAGGMGAPVPPVKLPPNLPPVGLSAGKRGSALVLEMHVPHELVKQLVKTAQQAMAGGPGGGL